MFSIAFVAITVRARVAGSRSVVLEKPRRTWSRRRSRPSVRVTLPLIMPAVIVAGFLLAFVLSLDDFVITNFVGGPTVTFPRRSTGPSRIGVPPQVNVMGHDPVRLRRVRGIASAVSPALASKRDAKRLAQDRATAVAHYRRSGSRRPPPDSRESFHKVSTKTPSDLRKRMLRSFDGPPASCLY